MNAKERYNKIIQVIENKAGDPYVTDVEIFREIARDNCLNLRDVNTVMKFLTDMRALTYIKERKMMAAYKHLISSEKMDISGAVAISGKDNHSAFDKAFKSVFNITPSEAFKKKDANLIVPALDWESISCETKNPVVSEEEVEQMESVNVFGVAKEQYAKIVEATELAEIYGLDTWKGNLAFELADRIHQPLESTFRFIGELAECGGGNLYDEEKDESFFCEEAFAEDADNTELQFLFFACGVSVEAAYDVIDRLNVSEEELLKKDPRAIRAYSEEGEIRFSYLEKAIAYYDAHATDEYDEEDFERFLYDVYCDIPIETAFDCIIPSGRFYDYVDQPAFGWENDDFSDPDDEITREEARWHGVITDREYDQDNLSYELDDMDDFE